MVYSPTGCSDLFLNLGRMISIFLYLSFSTFYSSSLWRTGTVVFAKFNKSRGLRPGSKVCSEHMNDWQYLSLGNLEQNEVFLCLNV